MGCACPLPLLHCLPDSPLPTKQPKFQKSWSSVLWQQDVCENDKPLASAALCSVQLLACPATQLSLWLSAANYLHVRLAVFSCPAMTWRRWVSGGHLVMASWPCRAGHTKLSYSWEKMLKIVDPFCRTLSFSQWKLCCSPNLNVTSTIRLYLYLMYWIVT